MSKDKLTMYDIELEIEKVKDFFEQIPDEIKAEVAERFMTEIVVWGSFNLYEGLGILENTKQNYRELCLQADEPESMGSYICVAPLGEGQVKVGGIYEVFDCGDHFEMDVDDEGVFVCCKEHFSEHFAPVEEVDGDNKFEE